jgi:hypothetical protein
MTRVTRLSIEELVRSAALMRDRSVRWRQNTAQAAEQTLTGRVKSATVGRNDAADHFVPPDEHEAATVLVAVCCAIG